MSETTGTADRRLRDPSPQIEAVCRDLEGRIDVANSEALSAFAPIFLGRASEDFLLGRDAADLANLTLGAFRFLEGARQDQVDVAVLNPDADTEGWEDAVTVVRASVSERPPEYQRVPFYDLLAYGSL